MACLNPGSSALARPKKAKGENCTHSWQADRPSLVSFLTSEMCANIKKKMSICNKRIASAGSASSSNFLRVVGRKSSLEEKVQKWNGRKTVKASTFT